jgi:hypothetical protein
MSMVEKNSVILLRCNGQNLSCSHNRRMSSNLSQIALLQLWRTRTNEGPLHAFDHYQNQLQYSQDLAARCCARHLNLGRQEMETNMADKSE